MKLSRYIFLLVAMMAMAACSSENTDEPMPVTPPSRPDAPTCEVVVSLAAGDPVEAGTPASRADQPWGDPYPEEDGTASESFIDNLYLYLVAGDGSLYPLVPEEMSAQGQEKRRYKAKVSIEGHYATAQPDGSTLINARIVAIANYPGGMPAHPFAVKPFMRSALDGLMPMWGVITVKDIAVRPDDTVDLGSLLMLRALPKITIQLHPDIAERYRIVSVTSTRSDFEASVNICPAGAETASSTRALLIEGCFNPSSVRKELMPDVSGMGSSQVWLYPSEQRCTLSQPGNLPPFFNVTVEEISSGAQFTGQVFMCDYVNGQPDFTAAFTSLIRNHDYQFTISLTELEFLVSVREWIFGGKVHIELT